MNATLEAAELIPSVLTEPLEWVDSARALIYGGASDSVAAVFT